MTRTKPGGRRGWRKWAKSRRLKMNAHHQKLYRGAIMRKKQPERTPLRARPLPVDHLVGRTQGARKRKARHWMECERLHQKAQDLQEAIDRSMGRQPLPRTVGHTRISLKEHYRIGERLRPCPGCADCHPNRKLYRLKTTNRVLQTMAGTAYPSLMEAEIIREERCGGSKLIEARKSRPQP